MRQGREYLAALRDGRAVYLSGERVADVAHHPAFAGAAQTVAGLYDLACDPANEMSYAPPDTDAPRANIVFMIPRSRDDLKARRLASTRWAQATPIVEGVNLLLRHRPLWTAQVLDDARKLFGAPLFRQPS